MAAPGLSEVGHAEANWWRFASGSPDGVLAETSFVFSFGGDGTKVEGGPCTVAGQDLASRDSSVARAVEQGKMALNLARGTHVSVLKVSLCEAVTNFYWFPYPYRAAGYCDIPRAAPIGTIALTPPMNGCSLRVYENAESEKLRFFHDNNGRYVNDEEQIRAEFTHVASVNTGDEPEKQRGRPAENTHSWEPVFDTGGGHSGVVFITKKTAGDVWTIYRSVLIAEQKRMVVGYWKKTDKEVVTYVGGQQYNGKVLDIVWSESGSIELRFPGQ